jgi:hypothetical protein
MARSGLPVRDHYYPSSPRACSTTQRQAVEKSKASCFSAAGITIPVPSFPFRVFSRIIEVIGECVSDSVTIVGRLNEEQSGFAGGLVDE